MHVHRTWEAITQGFSNVTLIKNVNNVHILIFYRKFLCKKWYLTLNLRYYITNYHFDNSYGNGSYIEVQNSNISLKKVQDMSCWSLGKSILRVLRNRQTIRMVECIPCNNKSWRMHFFSSQGKQKISSNLNLNDLHC